MISAESYNTFIEMFSVAHDCTVQTLDDIERPIIKVIFNYKGHEHKFEMPLRQDMSLDDLGLIFHDEWEKSGFDNITISTKDAGEDWYNRIAANPDITDPMAAYDKIDAEHNKTDICPFCNPDPGPEEATDLVSIRDGELRSSTWIDFHRPDGPELYSSITFQDGDDRSEMVLKYGTRAINFCPMCGRKIREA